MTETPLDRAFCAQEADPADPALRLRFHERVLDAELLLLLDAEPAGDRLQPRLWDLSDGRFVLAFDRDDRLAAFAGASARFAALAGRRLVALIAGQGIGIGLNLGEAPSATLLPAASVDWMAAMGEAAPGERLARPRQVGPPAGAPAELVAALGAKLAAMSEVVAAAHLVAAEYGRGETRLLLALGGVPETARSGVAAAVAEAVRFSGVEAGGLDVTFLEPEAPEAAAFARAGLGFARARPAARQAGPGMDPARPPRLRR